MIKILFATLLLPFLATAQTITPPKGEPIFISKTLTAYPGEVYLDSVIINRERIYLDPDNILETKVFKGESLKKNSGTEGATLITRKVQGDIISLTDFSESIKAGSSKLKKVKKLKLMVNDEIINNPDEYRIELSGVRKVSILNFHEKDDTHEEATATVLILIKGYSAKKQ